MNIRIFIVAAAGVMAVSGGAHADELRTVGPTYDMVSCIPWQGAFSCSKSPYSWPLTIEACRKMRDATGKQLAAISNYNGQAYAACVKRPEQSLEIVE